MGIWEFMKLRIWGVFEQIPRRCTSIMYIITSAKNGKKKEHFLSFYSTDMLFDTLF